MGKLKKLFISHGEKILMGVVALVVLAGLAGADWVPYEGTPGEITTKARQAEEKWKAPDHAWAAASNEEERKKYEVKPEDEPAAVVDANIRKTLPLSEVTFTQRFARSPYETTQPLRNPEWQPLQEPIATAGRVLLAVTDEKYIKEMELRMQNLGPDGKPLPPGSIPGQPKTNTDNIPDEFLTRPNQAGGLGAPDGLSPAGLAGTEGLNNLVPPGTGSRNKKRGTTAPGGSSDGLAPSFDAAGMLGMSGMAGPAGGLPPGQTGRGFHYVSVRAVFPIRDQIHKVAEATNFQLPQAATALQILDYRIERQTMLESGDPWGGPWEPVDINMSTDVLTKMAVGLEPDVVYPQVTDPAMTMPLPARVSGMWKRDVTHPRIEKFTLTDEQIKQEVMYQEEALKKLEELKKELPPPPAQKGGWTNLVTSGSQLNNMMMGADPSMAGSFGFSMPGMGMSMGSMGGGMPMTESSGAYGASGYGASPFGGGIGGPQPGAGKPPAKIKPIDELVKMKDKDRAKEIQQYVEKVVSVVGELLLFRYIDFSVEPGKTYRYRARLVFRNPNFNRNADEAAGDTSVVTGETRMSDWSEPTIPVPVDKDQKTFVTDVRTSVGFAFPSPMLDVFQWDPNLGSTQQAVLPVPLGQTISGKRKTDVLDPAKASFEVKDYAFQST
ncbi:MAG TPA: hypothetical protein VM510_03875, partial [Caulifigura sp.]|nr:hypothetical protein [Caulifigura sp.]